MTDFRDGMLLDDRYEIRNFIGKGGMALVYRAKDLRTGHDVAVKVLRPDLAKDEEFLERFDREASAASKMSHHNIVNLLDVGQADGLRYLVMEYVKGKTLKEVIRERAPLPPMIAGQIAIRILSALQHAHDNGIIHRDIKPQNILVHSEGHIKVADFGIARVAGAGTISKADSMMGSVYYFSPEQARGEDVTAASDIYSVGVVLYEMLTGKVPFDGDSPVTVAMLQISGEAAPISSIVPNVPPAMEQVVRRAMQKRPEMRYQTALEMARDLRRAMEDPNGQWDTGAQDDKMFRRLSQDTSPTPPPIHWKNRLRSLVAAVLIGALVLTGLGVGIYSAYDLIVNSTEVPYLLDETEDNAVRQLSRSGLRATITRTSDNDKPVGTVIMQAPDYSTRLKKGETVALTISTGPKEQVVPDLKGMSASAAEEMLEKSGFKMIIIPERALSREPLDTVLIQTPEAGDLLSVNGIVQVTLSGGSVQLPDLIGTPREKAERTLESLGIAVRETKEVATADETKAGLVAALQYFDSQDYPIDTGTAVLQTEKTSVIIAYYVSQ